MKRLPLLLALLAAVPAIAQDAADSDIFGAIEANDIPALLAFVEADKDAVSTPTEGGMTPALYAAQLGRFEALYYLLENGADPNAAHASSETAPLHWAAAYDSTDCIKLLLERGAKVSAKAKNGFTPLHYAARKGSAETLTLLLKAGADPNAPDQAGDTPLHIAAINSNVPAIETLLAYDADPDRGDRKGRSPREKARTDEARAALGVVEKPAEKTAAPAHRENGKAKPKRPPRREDLDLDSVDRSDFVNPFQNAKLNATQQREEFLRAPGTIPLEDGSGWYNGPMERDRFEGAGILLVGTGRERYEGNFHRGVKQGHGVYHYANGDVLEGEWRDNAPDGECEFRYADGCSVRGVWRKGVMWNASGTFKTASGTICFATWEEGALASCRPIQQ